MGLINTIGYFKGTIIDGALGQSSGGLPQEVWALKATEVYDEEGQEYLPADDEHDEITAYLILMSYKDKETKTAQQVKKVLAWNGASYVELAEIERTDVPLSFRIEYGKGDYSNQLQVSWVAEPDASPTRTVSKISKEDAAALQARYAPVLAATKAPTKPVSAKKGKKTAAKTPAKGKRPTAPKTTVVPEVTHSAPVGKCSADDAYNECFSLMRDDVTLERLNELWTKFAAQVNKDETAVTDEQWYEIKTKLLAVTAKV